jgi:hypothetical protein
MAKPNIKIDTRKAIIKSRPEYFKVIVSASMIIRPILVSARAIRSPKIRITVIIILVFISKDLRDVDVLRDNVLVVCNTTLENVAYRAYIEDLDTPSVYNIYFHCNF